MGYPFSASSGEVEVAPRADLATSSGVSRERRDEIAARWLREKSARSQHTADRYGRDIAAFFRWSDEHGYDVFAMLPWHVGQYAADLKGGYDGERARDGVLSAASRAGRINAVSAFYRFVQRNVEGAFIKNPAEHVDRPVVSRESRTRGLEADELSALRKAAQETSPRDYAMVQLLAGAGLRVSEALEADTRHLQREGGEWYLYVKRKGHEDRMPVQVPAHAAYALRRYWGARRGPAFLGQNGERLSRRAALNRIRSLAKKAGITGRNLSPHSLRHTATTLALSAGVPIRDVQVQMGHASTETTARYDRANRARRNPTVAALDALIADDLPEE